MITTTPFLLFIHVPLSNVKWSTCQSVPIVFLFLIKNKISIKLISGNISKQPRKKQESYQIVQCSCVFK